MKNMYINGSWVESSSGNTREVINPFNQEKIATVTEGNEEDTRKAISAAREAFDNGKWSGFLPVDREKLVREIGFLIERDKEELANLESLDTGKTMDESRQDMDGIAEVFQYYAGLADKDGGEMVNSPIPGTISKVVRVSVAK